jgi:hypothetical protein
LNYPKNLASVVATGGTPAYIACTRYATVPNVRGDAHRAAPKGALLNLIFSHIHPISSQKALGPFKLISLSADGMRGEASPTVLAAYLHHQWHVEGLDYFRLDCTSQVSVHFERTRERSGRYGPFERFSAVNGLAYGDDRVIAFLDSRIDEWLYYDSGYHWPLMVISDLRSAEEQR